MVWLELKVRGSGLELWGWRFVRFEGFTARAFELSA